MVRIVVIDAHRLFREGLRALAGARDDLTVVGDGESERDALALVDAHAPDVVTVEIDLPGGSGLAIARELRRRRRATRAVMITRHANREYVARAFAEGASGFALKLDPFATIADGLVRVAGGGRHLSSRLPRELLDDGHVSVLADLSAREREVFDLVVRGFSTLRIAAALFVAAKTVETHRASINRKLGLHSPPELVRFAARHGLICDAG